ncbi:hypothetical protein, partial [Pseudomonas viridiflava]|uniref:hypothetical protein n=1 Tax=Pseudomonas viridiflava TaxID=33069 RepID=UPI0013DA6851
MELDGIAQLIDQLLDQAGYRIGIIQQGPVADYGIHLGLDSGVERQTTTEVEQVFQQRPVTAPGFDSLGSLGPVFDRLLDGVLLIQHMLE